MQKLERPRRVDGRQTACSVVDAVNLDIYHQAQNAPVIYGPSGKLKAMAQRQPHVDHMEAWLAPDPDTEEAAVAGLVMGVAWLADMWVIRHGRGLVETMPAHMSWLRIVEGIEGLLPHLEVGRLSRAALRDMLEQLRLNELTESKEDDTR